MRRLMGIFLLFLLILPSSIAQSEDFTEALENIKEASDKLNELIEAYKNQELDVIKTEDVTIVDQNGNGVSCTFETYYNDYQVTEIKTGADGKFLGHINHYKRWPTGVISFRLTECPCQIVSVKHDTTFPGFDEAINRLKGVFTDEVTDWVKEKGQDAGKEAVEKAFESVGASDLAGPFLWGVGVGADLGAPIGEFLTSKINEILEQQLKMREQEHQLGDMIDPRGQGRLRARWNIPIVEWFRTDPVMKNTWNIQVRCGGPVATVATASWQDSKIFIRPPPRAQTTGQHPQEPDNERREREERERRAREEKERYEREEREYRERQERERREREEREKREREERERALQAQTEQIKITCPLCEPLQREISAVEEQIAAKQAEIGTLEQQAQDAQRAADTAQRDLKNAKDALNNFENPRSWASSDGRTVTSTDLAVDREVAQENWESYRNGEQSAQETVDNWNNYNDASRAAAKQRVHERLKEAVKSAEEAARDAATKAREAQNALGKAKQELANLQKTLERLKKELEECLKKCKEYARQIAEGMITNADQLIGYGEPAPKTTPVTPTTPKLLNDCDRYKEMLRRNGLTDTTYESLDEAGLAEHKISESMRKTIEQYRVRCDQTTTVVEEEEEQVVTPPTTVTPPPTTQPKSCSEICSSKGMSTTKTDWSSHILNNLNQNGVCASSATIGFPGSLRSGECVCYSTREPTISISSQKLVCRGTACGDVACNSQASCSCGTNCVQTITCSWGGWKKIGEQAYQPTAGMSTA